VAMRYQLLSLTLAAPAAVLAAPSTSSDGLQQRASDYISSCGDEWVPLEDFTDASGKSFIGYNTAVRGFCSALVAADRVVPAGTYARWTQSQDANGRPVGLNKGQSTDRAPASPGSIDFEVHNKMVNEDHSPNCERLALCSADYAAAILTLTSPASR
jgi:hypothetical protein